MPPSDDDPSARAGSAPDPETAASVPADVADLVDRLLYGDERERRDALESFDELTAERESGAAAVADHLETMLVAEDAETRRRATLVVDSLVDRQPDAFARLRPELAAIGSDIADPARERAVLALSKLALERPDLGAPATETLVAMCHSRIGFDDEPADGIAGPPGAGPPVERVRESPERERRDAVRIHAAGALTRIAAERPDAVVDHVPRVGALLEYEDENHLVRSGACEVLESMARSNPDSAEPFAPALASLVATSVERTVVWRAADALEALAEGAPEAVGEAVASLAAEFGSRLESTHPGLRGASAGLLAYAAEVDPSTVEPFVPRFRDLLADEQPPVRANAALTLGLVDAVEAREELDDLATNDPDEDVRTLARSAVDRLEAAEADDAD
ncbi:HEAT repeat domain-containing protein [Natrononativus amylolyticus]|uniref:HEAT repeat domain-containing protein n=1 Tax=Natrononativus amylolyticus TaxID=2963434 RepID=UPI0020CE8E25|nr:HEAT repeat domain-containing protein [Natrononativus amylolyticus]